MILWLHPDKLDPVLVSSMGQVEGMVKKVNPAAEIVVNADWSNGVGHVADSQHYTGKAVDFHVTIVPLIVVWLILERFPALRGIGFYPFWNTPGFHADTRDAPQRARWARNEAGVYIPFDGSTVETLLKAS